MKAKVWMNTKPEKCDACGEKIGDVFSDMKTKYGPWAILCENCADDKFTFGYGTGFGQQYRRDPQDGKFVKVQG